MSQLKLYNMLRQTFADIKFAKVFNKDISTSLVVKKFC